MAVLISHRPLYLFDPLWGCYGKVLLVVCSKAKPTVSVDVIDVALQTFGSVKTPRRVTRRICSVGMLAGQRPSDAFPFLRHRAKCRAKPSEGPV